MLCWAIQKGNILTIIGFSANSENDKLITAPILAAMASVAVAFTTWIQVLLPMKQFGELLRQINEQFTAMNWAWDKVDVKGIGPRPIVHGLLHGSATFGTAVGGRWHYDRNNGKSDAILLPDYHVSLSENPALALLVHVPVSDGIQPILVRQSLGTMVLFRAAEQLHGAVHVSTYMQMFKSKQSHISIEYTFNTKRDGIAGQLGADNGRLWCSCYTKSSFIDGAVRIAKALHDNDKSIKVMANHR